uniref:Helicase ATP-binding domain-containing protein n=1 Tax=Panagrolaimus sp. PS1159 TaxID=55785 RepID=A0AC35FLJ4_9BILA
MSLLDLVKSLFGVSTNKKKADSSPKNPTVSERLTSSSNNGYVRRYESGECLTNQSNMSLINNQSATSSLKTKVIPPIKKSSISTQMVQPRMSNALNSRIPTSSVPSSSTKANNTSPTSKPFFTSYSTPFNSSQTENESKSPIPKLKTKFSAPNVTSSRPSSSKPVQSLASKVLNNEFKIQERPKTIPSTVNNAVSNNLLKKSNVNNELKAKDSVLKASGSRQSKRQILVDTSISKTSPKAAPVLNAISKKISTNKIQPVDNVVNQIYKPLNNQSKKKFSTVSSTFTSSSSSSSELQSLASNAVVESKKKKKIATPKTSEVSKTVLNPTLKILEEKKKFIVPLNGKVEPKQEILPLSKNQKKRKAKHEKKCMKKLDQNGKTFNGKKNQLKNDNSKIGFVLPEETMSIENYYKSCNLTYKDGVYLDPNGHENEFLMGCLIFDENDEILGSDPLNSTKVLPTIYFNLLNAARANKKQLSAKLLKVPPNNVEILPKLRKKIVTVEDAGKKFEVFNYLQLIEDFLESDEPLAKCATVSVEEKSSKDFRNMINVEVRKQQKSKENVIAAVSKNIMIVTVPFEKDSYIEEKITFMSEIYLFPEFDVKNTEIFLKVKVAKILPSSNKSPTTFFTLVEERELKKLPELGDLNRKNFSIFTIPNVLAANALMQSIKAVTKCSDLSEKIFPPYKFKANEVQHFQEQMHSGLDSLFYNSTKSFNQKQKEAIYAMTRPVNTTFLLFGPPGTGKTYTLVETISQLLKPESGKTKSDRRILICTPSNMAADAIAEGIVDRKFVHPDEIFRIVSASCDTFQRNVKLDCITKRKNITDPNHKTICTVYDLPNYDMIKEYKIIICTLGSLPRLSNCGVEPGHFSHIFVDEAAQAPEMDVWLAVGLLATKETRLIIAGDPKQLGPLTNNHRSHEGIVKISSELFYENSLVATKPAGHDSLCCLPFLPKLYFPILFHSVTSGKEETSVETRSKRNLAEVAIIVEYVEKCLKHVKSKDIGVVSPYKYQAESIRQRLNNKEITVETVEKYQGSERRVIIISTVRTSGKLGFMADNLRFNTAITRAKHLLIVVGNVNSLSTQKSWKRFIDYCGENGSMVKGFRDNHESIQQRLANLRI